MLKRIAVVAFLPLLLVSVLFIPALSSSQSCVPLSKPLSLGSRGADVSALQKFLYGEYKNFPTSTGYFGPITEAAVKQWQQERGIVSSGSPNTTGWGVVGPKTTTAMKLCSSTMDQTQPSSTAPTTASNTRTLTLGMRGSDVLALQQFFIAQKLLSPDSATGYFGPLTKAAVISFQHANNLEAVGVVGPKTRALLNANIQSGGAVTVAPAPTPTPLAPATGGGVGRSVLTPTAASPAPTPTSSPFASPGMPPCTIDTALIDNCVLQ